MSLATVNPPAGGGLDALRRLVSLTAPHEPPPAQGHVYMGFGSSQLLCRIPRSHLNSSREICIILVDMVASYIAQSTAGCKYKLSA